MVQLVSNPKMPTPREATQDNKGFEASVNCFALLITCEIRICHIMRSYSQIC